MPASLRAEGAGEAGKEMRVTSGAPPVAALRR